MREGPDISRVAALIGDPARANMLSALTSGMALTASELAAEAGVTLQTASSHLSKLEAGGLITPRKDGRHKYFRLASEEVASVLEALMGLAAGTGALRTRPGPRDPEMRRARVCYNHLAGDMGTQMYDSLLTRGMLVHRGETLELSQRGQAFIGEFGIDLSRLPASRAPLCRECLDWSERRSHLAGQLGRAMLARIEEMGWARRIEGTRVVRFTREGDAAFARVFGGAAHQP